MGQGKFSKGCNPDTFDVRDHPHYLMLACAPTSALVLPPLVDMRKEGLVSPVRDQSQKGFCVYFAWCGIAEHHQLLLQQRLSTASPLTILSPDFLGRKVEEMENTVGQDAGAMPRDGGLALIKFGACPEADEPYSVGLPGPCTDKQMAAAASHKLFHIFRCGTWEEIATTLRWRHAVMVGVQVPENMESDYAVKTGIVKLFEQGEQSRGGHGVGLYGYGPLRELVSFQLDAGVDGDEVHAIVKNSWSADYGDHGFNYIPTRFFQRQTVRQSALGYCFDAWSSTAIGTGP